jgi:ribosomal silencing factor RsfS
MVSLLAAAAQATQTDNTVAIVAISVTGLVGLVGPVILSFAASRRQQREADAFDNRQERELSATRARENREARRAVLEDGAVLLHAFHDVLMDVKPVKGEEEAQVQVRPDLDDFLDELRGHRARLHLWFPATSEIIAAFDEVTSASASKWWYANGLGRDQNPYGESPHTARIAEFDRRIGAVRDRYLAVARHYLTDEPEPTSTT